MTRWTGTVGLGCGKAATFSPVMMRSPDWAKESIGGSLKMIGGFVKSRRQSSRSVTARLATSGSEATPTLFVRVVQKLAAARMRFDELHHGDPDAIDIARPVGVEGAAFDAEGVDRAGRERVDQVIGRQGRVGPCPVGGHELLRRVVECAVTAAGAVVTGLIPVRIERRRNLEISPELISIELLVPGYRLSENRRFEMLREHVRIVGSGLGYEDVRHVVL